MKPSHTTLDFCCASVPNSVSLFLLDKNTSKQTYKVRRVKKCVGFVLWHEIVDCCHEVVFPNSILSTHMFLLVFVLFLTTLEQALCVFVSKRVSCTREIETNWLLSSYLRDQLALETQTQECQEGSRGG